MRDRYLFPAIFSYDDDGISISFPDLPGCLSCAHSDEEALSMSREALALHLYGMEEDNDPIPDPSSPRDIVREENEVVVLVEAWMVPYRERMANKAVNKTLTVPKWLNDLAEQERVNFSQLLQTALKEYLGIENYEQLRKQPH